MKRLNQVSHIFVIFLLTISFFVYAPTTHASFIGGILSKIGIGNNNSTSSSTFGVNNTGNGYGYNPTQGVNDGSIKLSKKIRREGYDQDFHQTTTIRSGTLVEVLIQVTNTSKVAAPVTVTDEIGGGSLYKTGSLLVNGYASAPGLTSGGLSLNLPAKSTINITYEIYVCSGSDYATRAYAYSAGIGSATDSVIIYDQNSNVSYYGNEVSACMNQLQSNSSSSYSSSGYTNSGNTNYNSTNNNPFGDWSGVNNLNTSTQTSSATSTTPSSAASASNPFAGWTGVNNSQSTGNPFGDWSGVNNSNSVNQTLTSTKPATAASASNPFAGWTGVNNNQSTNNPFGDWSGVGNGNTTSSNSNPFSDWSGVGNGGTSTTTSSPYNSSGYSAPTQATYATSTSTTVPSATNSIATSTSTPVYPTNTPATNYVAPKTGVDKTAPLIFAGLLTLAFFAFRKRQWLFN